MHTTYKKNPVYKRKKSNITLYFKNTANVKACSMNFIRNILGEHLNVEGMLLDISRTEYGKPYLRDYPECYFNISHTSGIIVCAVADRPVGVDVERIKPFNKRIVKRFFVEKEQNYIFELEDKSEERFAEIWTKKEAYVKCIGKGLDIPFESFDVFDLKLLPETYSSEYRGNLISMCLDSKKRLSYVS